VTAGSTTLGRHLDFTAVTKYKAVDPGTVTVTATGTSESGSTQYTLAANTIYTFVVLDDSGQLKVTGLVDSAGANSMPQGGAQTGFGGTAARPGDSVLPWAGAAAAGLLVAVGGLIGLRRRRRPAMHAR
jgi:LPXTG-motif cell wall-anchored protein